MYLQRTPMLHQQQCYLRKSTGNVRILARPTWSQVSGVWKTMQAALRPPAVAFRTVTYSFEGAALLWIVVMED